MGFALQLCEASGKHLHKMKGLLQFIRVYKLSLALFLFPWVQYHLLTQGLLLLSVLH